MARRRSSAETSRCNGLICPFYCGSFVLKKKGLIAIAFFFRVLNVLRERDWVGASDCAC